MTIREVLIKLRKETIPYLPNKDADVMKAAEYIFGVNETGLLSKFENEPSEMELERLEDLITRLKNDEPLEYITGIAYFHDRRFRVNSDVLIPRVETEMLVDLTIAEIHEKLHSGSYTKKQPLRVVDVGTGSGCIIVSVAMILREDQPVKLFASDISPEALEVAQENIKAYELDKRIETQQGDLLEPFEDKSFDIMVANLPYVTSNEMKDLPKSVQEYEPETALDGGKEGVDQIQKLITEAENATVLLEVNPKSKQKLTAEIGGDKPKSALKWFGDLNEKERFVRIGL